MRRSKPIALNFQYTYGGRVRTHHVRLPPKRNQLNAIRKCHRETTPNINIVFDSLIPAILTNARRLF